MIIGITGCIGSGKSYVLKQIEKMGFLTYDTDQFTREAYEDDKIKQQLNQTFACLKDNQVDKEILKMRLLENEQNLEKLNAIIHPFIYQKVKALDKKEQIIFVEIPLLFETNFHSLCQFSIAVHMAEKQRSVILSQRNPFHLYLAKNQLSAQEKKQKADFVIENNFDSNSLNKQIQSIVDYFQDFL